jgi:hypothetical protein
MGASALDVIKLVADVLLIPIMGMVWSVQGRISKLEGIIESLRDQVRSLNGSGK